MLKKTVMIRRIKQRRIRYLGTGLDEIENSSIDETVLGNVSIPLSRLKTGDVCRLRFVLRKSGTQSDYDIKLYWNTSATLNGSEILLGTYSSLGGDLAPRFHRVFVIKSSSTLDILNTTVSKNTSLDQTQEGGQTVTGLNFDVNGAFFITSQRTTTDRTPATIRLSNISIEL